MKLRFIIMACLLLTVPASAIETEELEYTLVVAYHPRTDRSARPPIQVFEGRLRGMALREAEPTILKDWEAFLDYLDDTQEGATIYWDTGCFFVREFFVADQVVSMVELAQELEKRGIQLRHHFGF